MKYSNKVAAIQSSPIREMMVRAAQINDVISFAVGEPDFLSAPNIIEAAKRSLDAGETKYAPGAGMTKLREVYVRYLEATIGVSYDIENCLVTTGGMGALFLGLTSLLNPGDEVIFSSPYWTNYGQQIVLCGGTPVCIDVSEANEFVMSADDLRRAITPKSKVILLNSPSNPTGSVMNRDLLREIAEIAKKQDLFVISDEVYRHILFDGQDYTSIASFPGMKKRTLIVDSCSKTHAMTGFRVGFATGPADLIDEMTKITEDVWSCVNSSAQYAAIEAFTNGAEYREMMVKEYERRRNYIYERINTMDKISCIKPMGAFYLFANIKDTGLSAKEFCDRLLDEQHVAVVPGDNFGSNASGYIRISYATSMEKISEGMDRIETFIRRQ
ncbi:pyridoxal phosphate-dependent aminotransferase [Sporolactobacillus shoreicorticis]|uniref:Aminotransferase n=1 Tax=Sporolactobacillus shoreicorticis TaxID=1923877 RepID=A0ABW5S156_9BACL|nr:pyridoxal phosphate-dependent aminotransferase [Sporolactobacillus shoreicorticis]MCO7125380.1 pyridoxal phosphate-dependent aminotransferase [Sporolactobacillus shoreicorticis]